MKFTEKLESMHACSDAVEWVAHRGIIKAWRECPRGDWMLWLAGRLDIDRKLLVMAACDCAETALKYVPDGEDRPAKCIQVTRNWCNGTATIDEVRAARRDADAAYAYADDADDADAADAAAAATAATDAADAAADAAAAYAADAAAAAAYAYAAAYPANARSDALLTCADLVRKRIPVSVIQKAMT